MALVIERQDGRWSKFTLTPGVIAAFMTPLVVLVVYFTGGQISSPWASYFPTVRQATPNPEDLSNYDDARLLSWLDTLNQHWSYYEKRDGKPTTTEQNQRHINAVKWQRRELIKELTLRGIKVQ